MLKKSGSCTGLSLEFGGIYSLKLSEVCGSGSSLLRIDRSQLVPGPKSNWSYSVMVITLDFESSDPGSNPGRTSFDPLQINASMAQLAERSAVNR